MEKKFSDMIQVSARGSLILMLGQMGSTMISAIGTIIIARILGSTDFGVISIAQIPVSVSLLLINNGVSNAMINYLAENRHKGNVGELRSIIKAGFIINVTVGIITSIGLYLLSGVLANKFFQRSELEQLIQILSLSVLAQSVLNTAFAVFVGFERMGQRSTVSIIYSFLKSVIGPLLVFLGYGVVGAAIGGTLPFVLAALLGSSMVLLTMRRLPPSTGGSLLKNISLIVDYSVPLFFSGLLSGSLDQIFTFVLPLYVTAGVIGNYSAAISFNVLVRFFITPLNMATFPLLSKLKPDDSVFRYVYQSIIKYESIVVFPIAAAIIALSDQLVKLLYGESYGSAPLFLRVFMLSFFFVGVGDAIAYNLLNSQKETRVTLRRTLIYIAIGAPMGAYLIPRYGVLGYQAATIIAPQAGLLYSLRWIKNNYGVDVDYGTTLRILASTCAGYLVCVALVSLTKLNPWLELALGGGALAVTYFLMVLVTGALTTENVDDIHSIVKKREDLRPLIDPIFSVMNKLTRWREPPLEPD